MNWSDLLQWEGNPLSQQAQVYEQQAQAVTNASEDLSDRANGLSGSGQTVTAAQQALRKNVEEMRKQAESLHSLATISGDAAKGADEIGKATRKLDQDAADKSIKIGADGSVDYVGKKAGSLIGGTQIMTNMAAVADTVSLIKFEADELVKDIQKNIAAVESGGKPQTSGGGGSRLDRMKLPPKGASPDEVAKWWSSLTDAEKKEMVRRHSREIGNLNGVEATWRDKANRNNLAEDLKAERQKLKDQEEDARRFPTPQKLLDIRQTRKRITQMENVEKVLDKSGKDGIQRQLVCFDSSERDVLAAVTQGNIDTADHVAVNVPGMRSNLADNLDYYDSVSGLMRENAEKHSNGQSVAVVTYMDYRAPQGVEEVVDINYAKTGSDRLAGFLTGLDASREHGAGDAHITPVGHSFGSTTVGMALTKIPPGVADDSVQIGSPGSGVQDVSEFNIPKGHAYVGAARYWDDMVQGFGDDGRFGKNPDTMPGYKHISGDVGQDGYYGPIGRHSGYFNEGSPALDDISRVIAGKEPK